MALGDPYCSVGELRSYCQIPDNVDDIELAGVAAAISNGIEHHCRRQFNDAGTPPTARLYVADSATHVAVDDFSTTTGLVVKTGSAGVFGTTLTGFTLEPVNGIQHGRPGFPYRKIRLTSGMFTTSLTREPTVEVTAQWGWAEVPAAVRQAALLQAARTFRRRYSPSGLQTVGSGDMQFTAFVSRIEDPDVIDLLRDFVLPSFQFC